MVRHQIHQNFDAVLMCGGQQLIEIFHCSEIAHDGEVVGNIVAVIHVRRIKHGGEPDNVNAQLRQVRDFFGDAGQVADTVAIGVVEGARVHLVDHRLLPPLPPGVGRNRTLFSRGFTTHHQKPFVKGCVVRPSGRTRKPHRRRYVCKTFSQGVPARHPPRTLRPTGTGTPSPHRGAEWCLRR